MRLFAKASYKFLEQRRTAYVVSAVCITLGILSIALRGGLNYGVDFTGGTLFQVRFESGVDFGDEAAIDLQLVHGQMAKIAER